MWTLGPARVAAAAILGLGALWLIIDIVTDDDPATTGSVFERIDA